jgi:preprotein translocase subunit YajC
MSHSLGVMIETLVALLLIVTIGYCMLLNARLKRLKADEHSLKAVIGELITATEIAERAIGGLKLTVRDVNEHLGSQIASATEMSEYLKRQLAEGDQVVRRLSKIAIAARPTGASPEPETPKASGAKASDVKASDVRVSDVKALAAAAQAFSDRKRSGGLAA